MNKIKLIEFHENGNIKLIEFYEEKSDWQQSAVEPITTAISPSHFRCGSGTIDTPDSPYLLMQSIMKTWGTPEDDIMWSEL